MKYIEPAIYVAMINIMCEIAKRSGLPTKFIPALSLLFGVIFGITQASNYAEGGMHGILFAGMALGIYRGAELTKKNV